MKFVLPFTGSRGDVQPGVALALELSARGHGVTLGAPPNLFEFASRAASSAHHIDVVPFGPDTGVLLESELVRTRAKSKNPRTRLAALAELANYGWEEMTEELASMAVGADAVVAGTLGQEMAFNIAEARSIAFAALHYCPVRANGSMSLLPGRNVPSPVNRAAWWLIESMRWRSMRRRENSQRRALGLPAAMSPLPVRVTDYGGVEIQAYDSILFPGLKEEWSATRPFVGFLNLPKSVTTVPDDDSELTEWILGGSSPVYFGFGSMPVRDPSALVEAVTQACARHGVRALISSGWSVLPRKLVTGSDVAVVGHVDHGTVLPRCRAAVHHGGAGTTAAGLRAALPTMVCWFSADQPFWGAALTNHGAGTSIGFTRLNEDSLASGLSVLLSGEAARCARTLADAMTPPETAIHRAADIVVDAARKKTGSS